MRSRSIRRAAERQAAKLLPKQTLISEEKRKATGPTTAAGKAISCLNNTKHGLTGNFRVLESESQSSFDDLRDALRAEHAPQTPTETLLVDRMAEHVWLSQRAQRIGDAALSDFNEPWFALMLRYRTTHDRAFHKCLAELRTVRRERPERQHEQPEQFESQNAEVAISEPETIQMTAPLNAHHRTPECAIPAGLECVQSDEMSSNRKKLGAVETSV